MLNAPLLALTFNEGSGTTTANTGTLGGSATILGSWATANAPSAQSGAYVRPGSAAAAASFNIAPDAYAADGIYTRAMLVKFDNFSGASGQSFLDGQHAALTVQFFGSSDPGMTASIPSFPVGQVAGGSRVPEATRYDWTLMALVATGTRIQVWRTDASGAVSELDAGIPIAFSGATATPLVIGGSEGLSPAGVLRGALDAYTLHNAALTATQLQELYRAAIRGHDLGREVQVNITGASSLTAVSAQGATLDALGSPTSLIGGAGNDTLVGSQANDSFAGGGGIDTVSYAFANGLIRADLSITTPQQTGWLVGGTLIGGAGIDTFTNVENLIGGDFNDALVGDGGANMLEGGAGQDTLNGAGGIDTASYAGARQGVFVDLRISQLQDTRGAGLDQLSNMENLLGSRFNDTLVAGGDGSQVVGGAGDDVLFGTSTNQSLAGGAGNDVLLASGLAGTTMAGGAGDDVYQHNSVADSIVEAAGEGFDAIFFTRGGAPVTIPQHVEVGYLTGTAQAFIGTPNNEVMVANPSLDSVLSGGGGDDELWASGGSDAMFGGSGNDVLRGAGGMDTMDGGQGDDTYVLTSATHIVNEVIGQGFDTVYQTIASWIVTDSIEVVRLFGDGFSVTGNAGADMLVANAGAASTLNGMGGSDTIWGQGQADLLDGGAADDVLRGGDGNDSLVGGTGNDQLVGGAGADRFAFNAPGWGFDTVHDFNRGQGDRIDLTGSGVSDVAALSVHVIGPNTMLLFGAERIDVYGVTDLSAGDFIFG